MKWFGKIGFSVTEEKRPGIFMPKIVERNYVGDVFKLSSRYASTEHLNDDISISNEISIIADPFAYENFSHMKYIEFMGTLWNISNITVERPRLRLTIGGIYNGES